MKHLLLALTLLTVSACPHPPKPIAAVVDCGKLDQTKLEALALQLLPLLSGKSPDWGVIEAQALAAGEQIGGCVLAELVNTYLTKRGATETPDATAAARATLEDFRAKHLGGAAILSHGHAL
jgi:hypothetical protein